MATQLNKTASIANSLPIEGSAILTEEPINGVRKEAIAATSNAEFFMSSVIFTRPLSQLLYVKYLMKFSFEIFAEGRVAGHGDKLYKQAGITH